MKDCEVTVFVVERFGKKGFIGPIKGEGLNIGDLENADTLVCERMTLESEPRDYVRVWRGG